MGCEAERRSPSDHRRPAGVRASGVAPAAVAAVARARAERPGRAGVDACWSTSRRAWCRTTCVSSATVGCVRTSQFGGRPRQLLRHRPRRLPEALQSAGGALHPALRLAPAAPGASTTRRSRRRPRVLFLCTGNSARSQIAEALLERMSAGAIEAASAGSHPKPLHPNAVRVLREAWHRHQREPHQAPRRVRSPAVRHGHHAVRPGPRGLPRVPVPPRARALEHPRPRARGSDRPCLVPGVRAHRSRARDPHQLPAPICSPTHATTRRSTNAQR